MHLIPSHFLPIYKDNKSNFSFIWLKRISLKVQDYNNIDFKTIGFDGKEHFNWLKLILLNVNEICFIFPQIKIASI